MLGVVWFFWHGDCYLFIHQDKWSAERRVEAHESSGSSVEKGFVSMLKAAVLKIVGRIVRDDRGATMLEYGLLVGLVAIAAIAGITLLGTELQTMFSGAADKL